MQNRIFPWAAFATRFLLAGGLALSVPGAWAQADAPADAPARYQSGVKSRDGIGKYYLGREIAHFMTHHAAPWLERPEREREERPDLVMEALKLKPGQVIADIGCGTGYYSWRMAKAVGEKGVVFGVEIQPEMLDLLSLKMGERGVTNVIGIHGTTTDPKLPQPVDLVLLVDVYHEFDQPFEMMEAICRSVKPGGHVVFIEFRGEDPEVPIKKLHKMTEAQVRMEMAAQPLEYVETTRTLPWQHVIVFQKRAAK